MTYDVVIVGSGPAGMFTALTISEHAPSLRVLMLEKGKLRATAEVETTRRAYEAGKRVNVTEGWGGAGAFSDGKLNLDGPGIVGGILVTGGYVARQDYEDRLRRVAQMYIEFGGDSTRMFGIRALNGRDATTDAERTVLRIKQKAAACGMQVHEFPIQHLGTTNAHRIVENIRAALLERGVEILTDRAVKTVQRNGGEWVLNTEYQTFQAKRVVIAPGRSGARWFRELAIDLGIPLRNNGVDIGVRVETSMDVMAELCEIFYELKVRFWTKNDDVLRTFCMCPHGRVAIEEYRDTGIFCANGHTDPAHSSPNCNFAILQTQMFTEPFNNPGQYGHHIAGMHTELTGGLGVLVQRLGDIRQRRRSTSERLIHGALQPTLSRDEGAIPGDISLAMPARFFGGILEFLEALDTIAPGINSPHTLLYSPEIKWYAERGEADPNQGFQALPGLHLAGDGVGYTRGLNQASVMGMLIGEFIAADMGK